MLIFFWSIQHRLHLEEGGKLGVFILLNGDGGCGWFCRVAQRAAQGSCDLPNHPPHILALSWASRGCYPLRHSGPEKDEVASCLSSRCGQRMASQKGWSTLGDGRPPFPVLGLSHRQTLGRTWRLFTIYPHPFLPGKVRICWGQRGYPLNFNSNNQSAASGKMGRNRTGNPTSEFNFEFSEKNRLTSRNLLFYSLVF